MATPTVGWYNDPDPENTDSCFHWDGITVNGPYSKSKIRENSLEDGRPEPQYMVMPEPRSTEVVVHESAAVEQSPQLDKGWSHSKFRKNPNAPYLMRYCDGSKYSAYFDGANLVSEVFQPEFYRHGGSPDWFDNGCPQGADFDLFQLVINRITPEQATSILGETAPMYNDGPTWIADSENQNLARWWDGNDFTGETELVGVIQQRAFDAELGTAETVSYAPGLSGSEAGTWQSDPSDPTHLIHWGGERWDRRKSLEAAIAELFGALGETVPAQWSGSQVMSPRHADLMDQLTARKEGVNGWYKEPARFDDLHQRVWHEGQWTEQTSQQVPGFYDDPFNDEILREWNNGWTNKTTTKEAERIRTEREALRQEKRQALKEKVLVAVADYYSPENTRQRRIDNENDRSRRLRDAASAAALEHHQGANNYYAQKDFVRMWRGKR